MHDSFTKMMEFSIPRISPGNNDNESASSPSLFVFLKAPMTGLVGGKDDIAALFFFMKVR
jgi:hypothetical protein